MANIKLKDLLKEMRVAGGVVSHNPWLKEEDDTPQINVKELVSSIGNYNSLGEQIYGKGNLKEVAETLSSIAEGAAQHTLSEVDDMFDKVTVSRNMKELTGLSKQFEKVASEANALQERMTGLYEDMGNILGRYYSINEKHVPGHDDDDRDMRDDMDEADRMMFREDDDYKAFFKKAMKKFNVTSVEDMSDDDKKDFFNYVDRNYKGKSEKSIDEDAKKKEELNKQIQKLKAEKKKLLAKAAKLTDYQMKQSIETQAFRITQQFNKLIKQRDSL